MLGLMVGDDDDCREGNDKYWLMREKENADADGKGSVL